jgi:hypothetical protein
MLTIMFARTSENSVTGYRRAEDVPTRELDDDDLDDDVDNWGSLCVEAFGRLCVDDHDEPVRRETNEWGQLSCYTSLYPLDEIHTDRWPEGLFEKLSGYTWWFDPKTEGSPLDVMAKLTSLKAGPPKITDFRPDNYDDHSTDIRSQWV